MRRYYDPKKRTGSKIYSAAFYDAETGDKGYRSTRKRVYREALDVVEAWRRGEEKPAADESPVGVPFSRLAENWLESRRSRISPHCYAVYKSAVEQMKKHFEGIGAKRIKTEHVERYLAKRAEKVSRRTVNNERAVLRRIFNRGVELRWLERNPTSGVEKYREPKRRIRVLERDDEKRLLEAAGQSGILGHVLCMLRSGLRRGTVSRLEWRDVDFKRGEWRIPARKMKSAEDFVGRPIHAELLAYLERHRKPAGLIFGELATPRWRSATEAAGLEDLRPHDLRRAFVTDCKRRGVDMQLAMFLSDHRDLAVVLDAYRAVEPEDARRAMALLENVG